MVKEFNIFHTKQPYHSHKTGRNKGFMCLKFRKQFTTNFMKLVLTVPNQRLYKEISLQTKFLMTLEKKHAQFSSLSIKSSSIQKE